MSTVDAPYSTRARAALPGPSSLRGSAADDAQLLVGVAVEEALCELRAAPDGEGVQAGARVGEEAGAVVGDAAAPGDVDRLERRCAVLGEGLVRGEEAD